MEWRGAVIAHRHATPCCSRIGCCEAAVECGNLLPLQSSPQPAGAIFFINNPLQIPRHSDRHCQGAEEKTEA